MLKLSKCKEILSIRVRKFLTKMKIDFRYKIDYKFFIKEFQGCS